MREGKKRRVISTVVIDGKVYIDATRAMEPLLTDYMGDFANWRRMGMPHIAVRQKTQIKYFYNIADCRRWFAGEDFPQNNEIYSQKELLEACI